MPLNTVQFRVKILVRLADAAVAFARPHIPSATLRRAARSVLYSDSSAAATIPHYWAIYVHDGRLPFTMPKGRYLVWFKDPRQDPRLRGGQTPERASDLRHMSAGEFKFWVQKNREAIAAGDDPPMVVTTRIRKATAPTPFFANDGGMKGFAAKANAIATPIVQKELTTMLLEGGLGNIKIEAVMSL